MRTGVSNEGLLHAPEFRVEIASVDHPDGQLPRLWSAISHGPREKCAQSADPAVAGRKSSQLAATPKGFDA
jgi:hypothetical protein